MADIIHCPFCGFKVEGEQPEHLIMLHIETIHPEGSSPFIPTEALGSTPQDEMEFFACEVAGCGEAVTLTELDSHLMLHELEDEPNSHASKRMKITENEIAKTTHRQPEPISHTVLGQNSGGSAGELVSRAQSAPEQWRNILFMPPKTTPHKSPYRRLGKSELGPFAHEEQMPPWLVTILEADGAEKPMDRIGPNGRMMKVMAKENWASGIIPVLAQLLDQDSKVEWAYLCQPEVIHVSKLKKEGGFCGYRNIQMLVSNMQPLKMPGYEMFDGTLPSIFDIQQHIETAWDEGINPAGREETGGIKGTRKYIGTPDAQAMLQTLQIPCTAMAFKNAKPPDTAQLKLFDFIRKYFEDGFARSNSSRKVRRTLLPSIYFQHAGHSLQIIGLEKKTSGALNLLVFDPMFHDSEKITKCIGHKCVFKSPEDLLRAYRRGGPYLKKYKEFEILMLGRHKEDSPQQSGNSS